MHDKIFERFFQTDVPQSMVNQGTGIGLAITKEFVKLHNGIITVKSEPEKGTCFTVLLPAKKIYEPSTRNTTGPVLQKTQNSYYLKQAAEVAKSRR
jgi:signal transduction histidine kinase